jgi:hypothetical protein
MEIMRSLSEQIQHRYELKDVQHMIDINNLESILIDGYIYSKNTMMSLHKQYFNISNSSVQEGRSKILIEKTNQNLHDYVPLYWGRKTPMVAALQKQNESLIFLMFSTNLLNDYSCVISDGNARSDLTNFKSYQDIDDLRILNAKNINTVKYASSQSTKRLKQAELLVLEKLPLKHLSYIVAFSEKAKHQITQLLTTHSIHSHVYVGASNYYYLGAS